MLGLEWGLLFLIWVSLMSLEFYSNPQSRGRIVRWMLEEVGHPYETHVVDYGAMKSAEYLAINPMGKVPSVVHDGHVVTEAAAIIAYLAETFPTSGLLPLSDEERARYYRWMFFAAGPVEQALTAKAFGFSAPDKSASLGYGSYEQTVSTLESALSSSPYVCGSRFTAADVYVGSHVAWGLMFKTLESRPVFADYVARLQARDAYVRASDLDNALIS